MSNAPTWDRICRGGRPLQRCTDLLSLPLEGSETTRAAMNDSPVDRAARRLCLFKVALPPLENGKAILRSRCLNFKKLRVDRAAARQGGRRWMRWTRNAMRANTVRPYNLARTLAGALREGVAAVRRRDKNSLRPRYARPPPSRGRLIPYRPFA